MPVIDVVEVESGSQLKQFINYPLKLYRDDPCYVTPLVSERLEFFDREKNPFFKTSRVKLFLAMNGREVVGRISTCINFDHNEYHHEKVGFFGFFDCPDDYGIASRLLKVAMITIKKEGMEKMRGPMNLSTNHECGFLVDGFDSPPAVMMTYNHPYLPKLAERFGLKKVMDLLAFELYSRDGMPLRIQKVTEKLAKRTGVKLRHLKMSDFDAEIQRINKIYNDAWQYNWGFVPMRDEEFYHTAKNLKQVVDPELVSIAECDGQPVGFLLALPDINQALIRLKGKLFPTGLFKLLWHTKIRNKINKARIVTFGVIPDFQKRGIDMLMYADIFKVGVSRGYTSAELSWVLESNELMCRGVKQMGAELSKRYRLVEMPI